MSRCVNFSWLEGLQYVFPAGAVSSPPMSVTSAIADFCTHLTWTCVSACCERLDAVAAAAYRSS